MKLCTAWQKSLQGSCWDRSIKIISNHSALSWGGPTRYTQREKCFSRPGSVLLCSPHLLPGATHPLASVRLSTPYISPDMPPPLHSPSHTCPLKLWVSPTSSEISDASLLSFESLPISYSSVWHLLIFYSGKMYNIYLIIFLPCEYTVLLALSRLCYCHHHPSPELLHPPRLKLCIH